MHFGQFRLGLRTLKTGVSVMLIIVIFHFFQRPPFIAALSCIFALRETWDNTIHFSKIRLMSNTVGGAFALLFFWSRQATHNAPWVSMILLPIFVMVVIVILDAMNYNKGVIGGLAALLMISLTIPLNATTNYVFQRITDTFIGVIFAIAVNRYHVPKKQAE